MIIDGISSVLNPSSPEDEEHPCSYLSSKEMPLDILDKVLPGLDDLHAEFDIEFRSNSASVAHHDQEKLWAPIQAALLAIQATNGVVAMLNDDHNMVESFLPTDT
eukprot:scaffold113545_cov33-Prasinocladus_malaysianus.AAC.2